MHVGMMKSRSCILLTSCAKFHIPFQETSGEAFADHAFCPLLHHGDGGQRTRRRDSTDTTSVIHILRRLRIQCREQPTLNYRTPGWRNLPYCLHCCMLLDLFFGFLGSVNVGHWKPSLGCWFSSWLVCLCRRAATRSMVREVHARW